jgi:hypothetical protein
MPLIAAAGARYHGRLAIGMLVVVVATRLLPPSLGANTERKRIGTGRIFRATGRLIRGRRRLHHLPTVGQIKAMAGMDGREPSSYLLDPAVNFVPEPFDFGYERELGRHALCFTCRDEDGHVAREMVVMRDGGGFDLLSSIGS